VLDVAVDIRFGSPTFGRHFSVELSGENHRQIWIPPGFAHGFSVLSDEAIFSYKCTARYDRQSERGIIYNDGTLGIDWKVDDPIVSEKDLNARSFEKIDKEFFFV
jgi:dTDP-4-dehydrorhamnose 3,5-epimerase